MPDEKDWKLDMLRRFWGGEDADSEKDSSSNSKRMSKNRAESWASIDLHTIHQLGEQIEAAEKAVDQALSNGYSGIVIIHGKGEGILRSQIIRMLEQHQHVLTQKSVQDYDGHSGKLHVKFRT